MAVLCRETGRKAFIKRIFFSDYVSPILTITEPVDAQSGDIEPDNFMKADLVVVLKKSGG